MKMGSSVVWLRYIQKISTPFSHGNAIIIRFHIFEGIASFTVNKIFEAIPTKYSKKLTLKTKRDRNSENTDSAVIFVVVSVLADYYHSSILKNNYRSVQIYNFRVTCTWYTLFEKKNGCAKTSDWLVRNLLHAEEPESQSIKNIPHFWHK